LPRPKRAFIEGHDDLRWLRRTAERLQLGGVGASIVKGRGFSDMMMLGLTRVTGNWG
jgi:hypothetical protein